MQQQQFDTQEGRIYLSNWHVIWKQHEVTLDPERQFSLHSSYFHTFLVFNHEIWSLCRDLWEREWIILKSRVSFLYSNVLQWNAFCSTVDFKDLFCFYTWLHVPTTLHLFLEYNLGSCKTLNKCELFMRRVPLICLLMRPEKNIYFRVGF